MEEILKSYNWREVDNNEWKKLAWTIRWDSELLEAYNDTLYYKGDINKIDLEQILIEIDDFLLTN